MLISESNNYIGLKQLKNKRIFIKIKILVSFIFNLKTLCIKNFTAFIVQNNSDRSRNLFVKIAKNHKETRIYQFLTKNLFNKDNVPNAHTKTKLM